jgi:hypothetical protein
MLSHRDVLARLEAHGWRVCGEGDWAYVLQSPDGRLAARVSPFEPAYAWFVELCRRCAGNRYVPRVELASPLEGGGHLTVLEYLHPAPAGAEAAFLRRWEAPDDADLVALRAAADDLATEAKRAVGPWDVGIDLGDHVLTAADGQLKILDLFYVSGYDLLEVLETDPTAFHSAFPPERRRYLLELPHFTRDYAAGDLARFRAALARLPGEPGS